MSKGLKGRDEITENSERGIEIDGLDGSTKGDRSPPSPVAGEVSNGIGHNNPEENMDDEMCDVMR